MQNKKLFLWALTSALAGFLFGFDTVVISGAEQKIQSVWALTPFLHGLAMSSALWGTVLGSLIGGWPTEKLGRRLTLLWIGVLYVLSGVGSGLAPDSITFMLARFIGGVGIGAATVASPLYISEISPPERRGHLAGLFQFNIVFGILVGFASNFLLAKYVDPNIAWRWMLGISAFPALVYTLMCFSLPESPRWLISHAGRRQEGMDAFRVINPGFSEAQITELADSVENSMGDRTKAAKLFTWRLRVPIMLAFLIAFFNQLSGINAILYFAPRIFEWTGLGQQAALLNSVGIGITNLIFTYVGLWLIDRLGRRTLLYIGSFGYIISLGLCSWAFFHWAPQFKVAFTASSLIEMVEKSGKAAADPKVDAADRAKLAEGYAKAKTELVKASADPRYTPGTVAISDQSGEADVKKVAEATMATASSAAGFGGKMVMLCIFAFIASHAIGQGTVIWVLISEIFPNRNRAAGQALGSFTHWFFCASLTFVFPLMVSALVVDVFAPSAIFGFFCFMMVLQLVWVKTMVPETKGVPLEEMQAKLGIADES
jgi:MFS family permease